MPLVPPEMNWLFSNRAQWYPQAQVTDYATATMRITVPAEYAVVASGVQASGSPTMLGVQPNGQGRATVHLRRQPAAAVSQHGGQPDDARRCGHGGARHRSSA